MSFDRSDEAAARQALREQWMAAFPRFYSPWAHAAFAFLIGLGLIGSALSLIEGLRLWELLCVPVLLVVCNVVEWHAHRGVLHTRRRGLTLFYDRHTPKHHRVFVAGDMAMRSSREFGLVLIPWYGILAIFAMTLPVAFALLLAGERNVAALVVATWMGYVVLYECLHLAYHLPPTSFVGRRRLISRLRRQHETHHSPELMQRWNFNVTIPLWDWIRGTYYRGEVRELAGTVRQLPLVLLRLHLSTARATSRTAARARPGSPRRRPVGSPCRPGAWPG